MNQLSKYVKVGMLSVTTLTVALSTGIVVGAMEKSPVAAPKESAFCTNLAANISKIDTNLANLKSKLIASRTTRDQAIAKDHAKWDQQLKDNRTKWDQQRQDNFTKLEARAKTDTQTSAVKAYETAIISAVSTRRSANDAARTAYRTSVDTALTAQRNTVNIQVAAFSSSVSNAETGAQAGCQATPSNGPAVRSTFHASLKSARDTYSSTRKADGNISSKIKQFAATRDASFHANDATFKTAAGSARNTLKTAFGSNA